MTDCRTSTGKNSKRSLTARSLTVFPGVVLDHLRWDLRSLFELAHEEGFVVRNRAKLLYASREAKQSEPKVLDGTEVLKCISILELRERLLVRLAILAGMSPAKSLGCSGGTFKRITSA